MRRGLPEGQKQEGAPKRSPPRVPHSSRDSNRSLNPVKTTWAHAHRNSTNRSLAAGHSNRRPMSDR
jgi:hypothetical protein